MCVKERKLCQAVDNLALHSHLSLFHHVFREIHSSIFCLYVSIIWQRTTGVSPWVNAKDKID